MVRRQPTVVGPGTHRTVELRGEHHPLTTATALREPAADDLLSQSRIFLPAIAVRGVKEVDAKLKRLVHERKAVRFARVWPKVHGPETEGTDV